jgi:diacylglycerol O-acyltransferase / wax synthase
VRFKGLLKHIESRLHLSPIFRQKLLRVPLELDFPYWIEDERFDLEYHVRHIALPKPGRLAPVLHPGLAHPRAAARPVAAAVGAYLVEGLDSFLDLPPDSFAILTKIHHAAIDVRGGAEITTLLHDTTAEPPHPEPPSRGSPSRRPDRCRCWRGRAAQRGAAVDARGPLTRAVRQGHARPSSARSASSAAPRAPADHALQRRGVAASRVRVATLHASTSSSASARWCRARRSTMRCSPSAAVRCAATWHPRRTAGAEPRVDGAALDPQCGQWRLVRAGLSLMRVPLGTELEDPVQRLRTCTSTLRTPDIEQAVGAKELTDVTSMRPRRRLPCRRACWRFGARPGPARSLWRAARSRTCRGRPSRST